MEQKVSPTHVGAKYGLIIGLGMVAFQLSMYLSGNATNETLGYLVYVIIVAGMYFACREFKNNAGGVMSFGEGFKTNLFVTLIASVISTLFTYVYIKFISPEVLEQFREQVLFNFEKQHLPDDQVEQAMKMMDTFMSPEWIAGGNAVGVLLIGVVLGAVVAAISKKEATAF